MRTLPPLPAVAWPYATAFTAKQMQEYATAAVLAERERCAEIADKHAKPHKPASEAASIYQAQAWWARQIAAAIRSQSGSEPADVQG